MSTDIVELVTRWIGTPYRHQASRRGVGTDCLGLVRGVWRETYGSEPQLVPAYSSHWAETGGVETLLEAAKLHFREVEASEMRDGDVLVFRMTPNSIAKHCGILTRAGVSPLFIHAYEGNAVLEAPLVPYWRRRVVGVFRFPDLRKGL